MKESNMMTKRFQMLTAAFIPLLVAGIAGSAAGQTPGFNYDESKVPDYKLPDPLVFNSGKAVTSAKQWMSKRRGEVLELFRNEVYGRQPKDAPRLYSEELERSENALGGIAIRRQIRLYLGRRGEQPYMDLLVYQPNDAKKAVPVFMGPNFRGNHTTDHDPAIHAKEYHQGQSVVMEKRGEKAHRWQAELIVKSGFAVATVYYGDIDPDFDDNWKNGWHKYFPMDDPVKPDAWGSIATWAWGLSRVVDYLESDDTLDHDKVALIGHSRLGKTALWAGAEDERFKIVISNNSGCGGAALSRRRFGETVERINQVFPHWFCDNFNKYNGNEDELPVDQHMLISLIAPRPVYIASATGDEWADPNGEFKSGKGAESVYALFGLKGLGVESQPKPNTPIGDAIGYHLREGPHDVMKFDWIQYIQFAKRHFEIK